MKIIAFTGSPRKKWVSGASETLCSYGTYQFEDDSKVCASRLDPGKKARRRKEVFPLDCAKAFEMGVRLVGNDDG
jgi:hypothetical protein